MWLHIVEFKTKYYCYLHLYAEMKTGVQNEVRCKTLFVKVVIVI